MVVDDDFIDIHNDIHTEFHFVDFHFVDIHFIDFNVLPTKLKRLHNKRRKNLHFWSHYNYHG